MYSLKNMWKAFLLLCMISPLEAMAEEQWCAVTDNSHIVSLSNISYLASTPGQTKFHVVLNDGSAIEEVESMVFAKFHIDGLEDVTLGTTTELSFTGEGIVISNAPIGASVTISTLDGRNVVRSKIVSESHQVDIASLSSAIYVLNVGGKSVKFRKL